MKVGEKADIVLILTSIAEKMYPNCNQTKSQTYKFDFIQFQKQLSIQFSGRITKEQINKMFEYIQDGICENFSLMIKYYLDQHHLEYSNFKENLTEINQEIIKATDARWIREYDDYYLDIKCLDNYFLMLRDSGNWMDDDEDIIESRICVVKYQDEKLNIISQLTQEFDDWYDKKISHDYFYIQKNLTNGKEFTVDEEIIPYYTHPDKLFELLQKLDQIETVEEVKELMKN